MIKIIKTFTVTIETKYHDRDSAYYGKTDQEILEYEKEYSNNLENLIDDLQYGDNVKIDSRDIRLEHD
jgi:hypothetical protein